MRGIKKKTRKVIKLLMKPNRMRWKERRSLENWNRCKVRIRHPKKLKSLRSKKKRLLKMQHKSLRIRSKMLLSLRTRRKMFLSLRSRRKMLLSLRTRRKILLSLKMRMRKSSQ